MARTPEAYAKVYSSENTVALLQSKADIQMIDRLPLLANAVCRKTCNAISWWRWLEGQEKKDKPDYYSSHFAS